MALVAGLQGSRHTTRSTEEETHSGKIRGKLWPVAVRVGAHAAAGNHSRRMGHHAQEITPTYGARRQDVGATTKGTTWETWAS
jgi:hypothetical protein